MSQWSFFPPGELATAVFPEPLYLIDPIVPWGGGILIHGAPESGKTQLALTLAVAVATGGTFVGQYRCRKASVLFVEVEMTRRLLQERIQLVPDARHLAFLTGDAFDIAYVSRLGALPAAWQAAQRAQPELVIVDSLANSNTADEMVPLTAQMVFNAWKRLFPGACVCVLHHDRKKDRNPLANPHMEEAARGSVAWRAVPDTLMHLSRGRETHDGHVATMSFSKCRTAGPQPSVALIMNEQTLLLEPARPTARMRLRRWLGEHPGATAEQARAWLASEKACGRSVAYELVREELAPFRPSAPPADGAESAHGADAESQVPQQLTGRPYQSSAPIIS